MSCFICGRSSCAVWFHSIDEQRRYEKAIEAFEKAYEIRDEIKKEISEQGEEDETY